MKIALRTGKKFSLARRYWRCHLLDAVLMTVFLAVTFYLGFLVATALADPSIRHNVFLHGEIPKGATIIPYNNPMSYPGVHLIETEPMSLWNWLCLFSPVIIPSTAIGFAVLRYGQWKKRQTHLTPAGGHVMRTRISKLGLLLAILLILSSCSLWAFMSIYVMQMGTMPLPYVMPRTVQNSPARIFGVMFLITYVFFVIAFFLSMVNGRTPKKYSIIPPEGSSNFMSLAPCIQVVSQANCDSAR